MINQERRQFVLRRIRETGGAYPELHQAKWLKLAFCATGKGGGIDNSCSSKDAQAKIDDLTTKLKDASTNLNKARKKYKEDPTPANKLLVNKANSAHSKIYNERKKLIKAQSAELFATKAEQAEAIKEKVAEMDPPPASVKTDKTEYFPDGRVKESCCVEERSTSVLKGAKLAKIHSEYFNTKLDKEQRNSIQDYQGSGYVEINSYLRGNLENAELFDQDSLDFIQSEVDNIASAIVDAPPLTEDIIVSRGLNTEKLAALKTGDVFQDQGFMSTSLDSEIVLDKFVENYDDKTNIAMMNIRVPKGTKALYLGHEGLEDHLRSEMEVLLQAGSKVKVTGVSQHPKGYKIIQGDLLP